ncbi:RusA family crossover junction endodeoxyribonuclease [Romboutsia sp.]|uniref:RusA family crossover junction endodeoxyribonuclease n=1 Tax=Romboutsia sp. TaxID=1965302 RepID=UPI002BEEA71D|nr:RusA family crossover junction endodeoxyribonuclease [Romboutsia sp.]HSQ90168.1 RusA family crossover junction endodeoxyribonuclease [Romboutsia sp.]
MKKESKKKNDKEKDLLKIARKNNDLVRVKPNNPKKKLKLTLPPCPSVNHAYKFVKGRRFMTKDALMFMQTTHQIVEREKVKQNYKMEKKGVWLIVEITYYFPDRLRRDGHNMHKVLADALNGCAYVDDQFILIRDIDIKYDKDNPRLEVVIYPAKYKEVEEDGEKEEK